MNPEALVQDLLKVKGITSAEYFPVREKTMFAFVFRRGDRRFGKLLHLVIRERQACILKKEAKALIKEVKTLIKNGQA